MGLITRLARSAASCAHVLVVEVPGHWRTRAAAERALLARGWHLATSAADADVLAVCGTPGPQLSEVIDAVWQQMPGPRVRVDLQKPCDAAMQLDKAHAELLDATHHRDDARSRPTTPPSMDHGEMDHGEMGHGEMGHGEMGHGEMGHGEMDMSPGGIPLAKGGEDRDGLEMDVLRVRLGPVLPHWPAGLVLRCALQGDVIAEAEAELLDEELPGDDSGPSAVMARRMDDIAGFLALVGWDDAAAEARVIRDVLLEEGPDSAVQVATARLLRCVRRSWVLRWSLRGIRPMDQSDLRQRRLPTSAAGDTYDRLLRMLERVATYVDADQDTADFTTTGQLPELVTGLDLATARLVLASLDLHSLRSGRADHELSHG